MLALLKRTAVFQEGTVVIVFSDCYSTFWWIWLILCSLQALKILRTAEFMPYVVFIAAPELETLRAMHKAVVEAGITTKLLTVRKLFLTVDVSKR